jgi:hypothetical protein
MRVTAYHKIDSTSDHQAKVLEEMRVLGSPTIRAIETAHGLIALEGGHRLAAAEELGLTPEIEIIEGEIPADILAELDGGTSEEILEAIASHPFDLGETYDF